MIIQRSNFGSIIAIKRGIHDGVHNYGEHIHQFCEYVFVLEGEIKMAIDGKEYELSQGQMAVIAPFSIHSFSTPRYCKIWICVFSDNLIEGAVGAEELYRERSAAVFTPPARLLNYLGEQSFINDESRNFDPVTDSKEIHRYRACLYLIYSEYIAATTVIDSPHKGHSLARILTYMYEHYTEPLTLKKIGSALGYSPKYISNCLAAIPKMNFRTMLNSIRVEYSKVLLVATELSGLSIALECGFSGETSFYRAFSEQVGMTPKEYRRSRRK